MAKKNDIQDIVKQYKKYAKDVLRPQTSLTFTVPILGIDNIYDKDVLKAHKKVFAELLYENESILDDAKIYHKNLVTNDITKRYQDVEQVELLKLVDQLVKNYGVALKSIRTKEKRKHQICRTFDIKLMARRDTARQLAEMRREAKNVYNYILDIGVDNYDYQSDEIEVLNSKTGEREKRTLRYINQQTRQAILTQIKDAISSLARKKAKGHRVGRLKFKSIIDMIPLNQYGKTHHLVEGKSRVKICSIKKTIYARGLNQIKDWEIASAAQLVWRADGIHLMLTCYKDKEKIDETNHKYLKRGTVVALDFGVGDAMTFGDGTHANLLFENSETWRNAERAKSRKKKGSSGRKKAIGKVRLAALRDSYKKDDAANKMCALISKNEICITQDDDFSAWRNKDSIARGSKKIQKGILGRTKAKLKERGGVYMLDKWNATTQVCPRCHEKTKHGLDEQGNITCSACHFEYPRNAGATWTMEHVAKEQFGEMLPAWFEPIDASRDVEETLGLARRRSAWNANMTQDISDPTTLDDILGHVDDASNKGVDVSGRKKKRARDGWTSKKKTRGKVDKWAKYSPNYDAYVRSGEEPEHADEPLAMTSSKDSDEARRKRNLDHRKRRETHRAIYFRDAKKRRRSREHARCEARDARRLGNAVKTENEKLSMVNIDRCTSGTGGINAGGDWLSRCESAVTLPCRRNQKPSASGAA